MENFKKAVTENLTADSYTPNATFTNTAGCPIFNNRYSMTAGPTGPLLVQDVDLYDKLTNFDREQLPPRNVHSMGFGVYGKFTATNPDIRKYSYADVFTPNKDTDVFVRFSGTFTGPNEANTIRDLRGFAIKFYTDQGNWDLLSINTPVFAVRDMKVGPDQIHAFRRDPRTNQWNSDTLWDFIVNHQEALHQTLMIFTDRVGTPSSLRNLNGWGCNTFSLINEKGERHWVKFHIIPELPPMGLDVNQAKLIAGEDPDFLSHDLRMAIEKGNYPRYKMAIQVMPEEQGYKHPWTFDCTKVWKHEDWPLIDIGVLELNRLPLDFWAETEQVAFSPSNVPPGISFSPDRLLQGRLMIYPDTQYHRLGTNYRQIPINQPHCPLVTPYAAGDHQMEYGKQKFPLYYPSIYPSPQPAKNAIPEPPLKCGLGQYYPFPEEGTDADYYEQPRDFYNILDERDKLHLAMNLAENINKITDKRLVQAVDAMLAKVSDKLVTSVRAELMKLQNDSIPMTDGQLLLKTLRKNLQHNEFHAIPREQRVD